MKQKPEKERKGKKSKDVKQGQKVQTGKIGKKNVVLVTLLIVITIAIVAGVMVFLLVPEKQEEAFQHDNMLPQLTAQENITYAYGVTGIGMVEAKFPITNLENGLEIEEVYVSSGSRVTEETPLLKLTDESLETVRTELEEAIRAADLAYRAGVIEYEQSKIVAYYDKESTLLSGKQADEVYKETISGLSDNVEKSKEALDEAKAQIAEYEAALANNTYYEDYQVQYYKDLYDDNLELLKQKMDEWGVSWSEVTTGSTGAGSMTGGGMSGGGVSMQRTVSGNDLNDVQDLHSQYVSILASLYDVLEQNLSDYEQAYADYETAVQDTSFNLQTLRLQLSSLEQAYAQAQESYDTSMSQAELTKATAVTNAEKAETNYEATMEKAQSDYETLESALEEAKENMELFETLIKDGCLYATEAGEILRMNVRSGGYIISESRLYTVSNKEEMTITVSVSQTEIAGIHVGDMVVVQSENNGIYNGAVTAINPISSSDSKTSITYSVTVGLNGNFDDLSANETVVVYFGLEG